MVIVILAALLILGIAYFQTTQGLFSAVIMAILSLLAAAFALNTYEPLARQMWENYAPFAEAIALTLLFGVPLLGIRFLVDRFIKGNVVFGPWPDRIGGGLFGLLTGTILVGILMISIQMLPLGPSFLGYLPYDDALRRQNRLWPFYPDEFVLGLGKTLSVGSLRGERAFEPLHEDLLLRLFCDRHRAGLGGRGDAPADAMEIVGIYPIQPESVFGQWIEDEAPPNPLLTDDDGPHRIVIVRVRIDISACDEIDNWWRLPATQFRLAYRDGRNFYPVAYLTWGEGSRNPENTSIDPPSQWRMWTPPREGDHLLYANLAVLRPTKWKKEKHTSVVVDWVFRLPKAPSEDDGPPPARPKMYLAFRRACEQALPDFHGLPYVEIVPNTTDNEAPRHEWYPARKQQKRE